MYCRTKYILLLFIMMIVVSIRGISQGAPKRHDLVYPVGRNTLNIETKTAVADKPYQTWSILRYGINRNIEFQVGWNLNNRHRENQVDMYGTVGLKIYWLPISGHLPAISTVFSINPSTNWNRIPLLTTGKILLREKISTHFYINAEFQGQYKDDFLGRAIFQFEWDKIKWLNLYTGMKYGSYFDIFQDRTYSPIVIDFGGTWWLLKNFSLRTDYHYDVEPDGHEVEVGIIWRINN